MTNDSIFYYKQILIEVQVHSLWNKKSEKSHPDYDRFRDGSGGFSLKVLLKSSCQKEAYRKPATGNSEGQGHL